MSALGIDVIDSNSSWVQQCLGNAVQGPLGKECLQLAKTCKITEKLSSHSLMGCTTSCDPEDSCELLMLLHQVYVHSVVCQSNEDDLDKIAQVHQCYIIQVI